MHFSAHKFYRAELDRFLLTYYRQAIDDSRSEPLGIIEYQKLDRPANQKHFHRYLYPENEQAMNAFYIELLQQAFADAKWEPASTYKVAAAEILAFLERELISDYPFLGEKKAEESVPVHMAVRRRCINGRTTTSARVGIARPRWQVRPRWHGPPTLPPPA